MLSLSNISIPDTLMYFKNKGVKVAFLVPTQTGLQKSIMDATSGLRLFLKSSNVHDYECQAQGVRNKELRPTLLFSKGIVVETTASFYRPTTKSGDPRVWIYKLKNFASPGDLIALISSETKLIAINCSNSDLENLFDRTENELRRVLSADASTLSPEAEELLNKLKSIHSRGYVKTLRPGDTGVGYTLETLLGISANSSKSPDYKGIELKAGRVGKYGSRQATIFSQVPNWAESKLKSSYEVLEKRGKYNVTKERNQLFHEISCKGPNSYSMQLELDDLEGKLYQIYLSQDGELIKKEYDVFWLIDTLISRIEEKHAETMWVYAETRGKKEEEEFNYSKVKHTKGVDPSAVAILLESGYMTVHYLIKQLPSGAAKGQGYLFKMAPKYIPMLFEYVKNYDLE